MTRRLIIAFAQGSLVDPVSYGAEADCQFVSDAAVAGGALTTVTSATAAFTSADTGKHFTLRTSAGAETDGTLTYVNATTCTMSTAAGGAITGGWLTWCTDDWQAWQDALDAALPGQVVDIAGEGFRSLINCKTNGSLAIPTKVTLGQTGRGPYDPQSNPAGNTWGPTLVVIEDTTDPAITLSTQSGLGDFIFYSANQLHPAASAPTAFAPMVQVNNGGSHIGRPYFGNAYRAIAIEAGRCYVDTVTIGALHHAVTIDHALDRISIGTITCHPFWRICEGMSYGPTAGTFDEWALEQGYGLVIYRTDALMIDNVFTFGKYGSIIATDSPDTSLSPRAGWAQIGRLDADAVAYGIVARSTADQSILLGQGTFSANASGVGTSGQVAALTQAGGAHTPELVVRSWSHRGTWAGGASSSGAGTLIVPSTNPG